MKYFEDTIASIATGNANSAISIVRVSGTDAIKIVNKIFKGKNLEKVASNTINYGHIYYDGEVLDEVLVSVFRAPKTFTCEDVVEINCHGGMYVTNQCLEAVLNEGARLAETGEFTKRAFLNGRIDLTQAEAVMDIIEASSKRTLKIANNSLRGDVYKMISSLRSEVLTCISKIEVNIDYPEYEDEEDITNEVLMPRVKKLINEINAIIKRGENSIILKEGIDTAIIGKPNVGKSSILNKLLREEKAIVTDIAGTTRDTIEGKVNIDGIILNLIDTAGVRVTDDVVERIGVEKSKKVIDKASLIILVFDYSRALDQNDLDLLELTKDKNRIIVINKQDLDKEIELSIDDDCVLISTTNDEDILKLEEKIKEKCKYEELMEDNITASVNNARQMSKLKEALNSLNDAKKGLDAYMPIDIVNIDLHLAWEKLGEIIGQVSKDDLINELFSKFCLGK